MGSGEAVSYADPTPRAPDLPAIQVDVADAVNLLWHAGQLPKDIHYAIITDENRGRFFFKAGPFLDHLPKNCSAGRTGVFLWVEKPGQPFAEWLYTEPRELIVAALAHYKTKNSAWGT